MNKADFLVIGSGVAGLLFALKAAETGSVCVVTKRSPSDTNTNWAQGGIAAVQTGVDSFDLHVGDTLAAGAGLCREDVVRMVVEDGPARVEELMSLGVEFSRDGEVLSLGREGGHSENRIVHCRDLTGREIQRVLVEGVRRHPNIELFDNHMAVGLITGKDLEGAPAEGVFGAYVLDVEGDRIDSFVSKRTVLATGGAGKVYLYTSNPDIATGDGIAMAYRAGARIANLEFVQFHPTCLYHPERRSLLLTEAIRGEGGVLRRADGHAFMQDYDSRGDLASRDVVARAIDREMKMRGDRCAYLDVTHLDAARVRERFPFVYDSCMQVGIDITQEPIPVVPATHYFCGGVDVDDWGESSLPNLFALGEVGHTGLHGANRLASNSLLEAVVYADRAAQRMAADAGLAGEPVRTAKPWDEQHASNLTEPVIVEHDWEQARRVMWDYVGIVRSDSRLNIARQRMDALHETVESLYWDCRLTQDILELRNIVLVGRLVIQCALARRESRGLHFTETYPQQHDDFNRDTIVTRSGGV